ncbi:TIGR00730 family Rossman fold protein [uncultured Bacteroides sp.]|uniref:LOG family protein n=1 Tax=uncultured Bacteroides sp. TaxID=162156 RepID=UPI002611CB09|nr:TIGR00730 family Rossman fold protein [uncultured Bacteroides sp.]
MNKIAVFCSASDHVAPVFHEKAAELGAWLGQHNKWLIYGGSNTGLMDDVARAAKENGAMIMGVVPTKLEERSMVSDLLDVTFRSVNLSDRKDLMLQEAEVMVALPGGVGTLDEIFHVMASATIGYHDKKVILYNVDGFWNEIISFLDKLEAMNFAHRPLCSVYTVANTFEELTQLLK